VQSGKCDFLCFYNITQCHNQANRNVLNAQFLHHTICGVVKFLIWAVVLWTMIPPNPDVSKNPTTSVFTAVYLPWRLTQYFPQRRWKKSKSKGAGKVRPRTGHEGPEGEQTYSFTLPLTPALDVVGGQRHAPAALTPGKTQYTLYRRLGEPQGLSGRVRKISPSPGFDPRTVQPIASGYTDCAIPAQRRRRRKKNPEEMTS